MDMRILALLPAALAAPLLVASCGVVHLPGSTECSTAVAPADGGPPGCPCDPPSPGDSCDVAPSPVGGPTCTYGTDQLPGCRQMFLCAHGAWELFETGLVGGCPATGQCPVTPPAGGTACAGAPALCGYPDNSFVSCDQGKWSRVSFTATALCPVPFPNAGTACSMPWDCGYPIGCAFTATECIDGVLRW